MYDDDEWNAIQPKIDSSSQSANRALRNAVLFGVGALAVTLVTLPLLTSSNARQITAFQNPGIDPITTATVRKKDRIYTMRQSVLQDSPTDVCLIRENGTYEGKC